MIGLIGDNGRGKSTFLRLVNKSLLPDSGEIITLGRVSSFLTNGGIFMSQFNAIESLKLFSLKENINFDNDLIDNFKDFSELPYDLFNRPLSTWSTGQAVRLAIYFLLKSDSDILLIDEFIGGTDKNFREKIKSLIVDRMDSSKIVVIASHDVKFLESISDSSIDFNKKKLKLRDF